MGSEDHHDASDFQAPQYDAPTRHDRIMAQSAHDSEVHGTLKWLRDHPLVVPIAVIAIGATSFSLW